MLLLNCANCVYFNYIVIFLYCVKCQKITDHFRPIDKLRHHDNTDIGFLRHSPRKEIAQTISNHQSWRTEHFILYTGHYGQLSNNRNSLFVIIIAAIALNRTLILPTYDTKKRLVYPYMSGFAWEKATKVLSLRNSIGNLLRMENSTPVNSCKKLDVMIEFEERQFYDAMLPKVDFKKTPRVFIPGKIATSHYDEYGRFRCNAIRLLSAFEERCLGVSNMYNYIPYRKVRAIMPSLWRVVMKALEPVNELVHYAVSYISTTFHNEPFISVHLRLGDFCDSSKGKQDRCVLFGEDIIRHLINRTSTSICGNSIKQLFIMTNDQNHTIIHPFRKLFNVSFYSHPPAAAVVSGVRELDITLIETEIASYGKCFIGSDYSTLSDEVVTRRSVSRNLPPDTTTLIYNHFD